MLITDVLFGAVATAVTSVLALTMFVVFWAALPLQRRGRLRERGAAAARSAARASELVREARRRGRARRALGCVRRSASPGPLPRRATFSSSGTVSSSPTCLALLRVGVAQHLDVGQLVGGVDRQRLARRPPRPARGAPACAPRRARSLRRRSARRPARRPARRALAHVVDARARCPRPRRAAAPPPGPRRRSRARTSCSATATGWSM